MEGTAIKPVSDTDQPVVAKSACLCGLDTNPVASPRMDVHCPKHDAPEAGGEPELLPWIEAQIEGIQRSSIVEASRGALNAFLAVKKKLLTTRISQPASEPSNVISREAAVRAVSTFCDRFETLGNRFKKQLRNIVRALPAIQPPSTPADEERETLIYWLLRCYHSGHRQGWEPGPTTTETMDGLLDVLANRGYDPNEDEAAKELLKQKPRF